MVNRLTSIWAQFAKTGKPLYEDPNLFGNVNWNRLTSDRRSYLDIGNDLVMKTDFQADTMKFWDELFP